MDKDGDLIVLKWRNSQILQTPLYYFLSIGWFAFYAFLDCHMVSNACLNDWQPRQITLELGRN